MLFDGKEFAKEIEATVSQKLRSGMRAPKIVSILVGKNPAGELYTRLKLEAAERVGIKFEVVRVKEEINEEMVGNRIREAGSEADVTGVMVQLPLPELLRESTNRLIKLIPKNKDVDGLRWEESQMMPATVRAVLSILERIERDNLRIYNLQFTNIWLARFVVVGSHGSVGKPLIYFLQKRGVKGINVVNSKTVRKKEITKKAEVIISCVGKAGVVSEKMVGEEIVAIDVGSPKGDMTAGVYQKARIAVPVPGGVGPVTIASLLENACNMLK